MEMTDKGFTKDNMKRLFTWKGDWRDWVLFIILLFVLFVAWAYKADIDSCSVALDQIKDTCALWEPDSPFYNRTGNDGLDGWDGNYNLPIPNVT